MDYYYTLKIKSLLRDSILEDYELEDLASTRASAEGKILEKDAVVMYCNGAYEFNLVEAHVVAQRVRNFLKENKIEKLYKVIATKHMHAADVRI